MFDVCVIGSGAGAGPVIYELSKAGYKVIVLEKGPWFKTEDFTKDEMTVTRRDVYEASPKDEPHVVEKPSSSGFNKYNSANGGTSFQNGSCVGGSSNFMSAYFHRLKPKDFNLLTEYGPIKGANIVDWPVKYDEFEPYYTKVEQIVGVSGKVVEHKHLEPRSTPDFPFPPLVNNGVAEWYIKAGEELGYKVIPVARGIVSQPFNNRKACYHSNYCGSFGCSSDGKSSSRAALIPDAIASGNCEIITNAKVFKLETDENDQIVKAHYYNETGVAMQVEAKMFVVACQAIESSRLLLMSKSDRFPNGLANNSGQVGKNMIFAGGGGGSGYIRYEDLSEEKAKTLRNKNTFINHGLTDFYEIDDPEFELVKESKSGKIKGGNIDFLLEHSAPFPKVYRHRTQNGNPLIGSKLKENIHDYFVNQRRLRFEIFCDWLPNDDCFVELDEKVTDKWGDPAAKVRTGFVNHDLEIGNYLADRAIEVLEKVGCKNITKSITGNPPTNLIAGGCRFGNDPKTSVLDKNCKAHEVKNLYVTDGSFMPTGGSAPHTFMIYANSFRVADKIKEHMKKLS
ncbi:GMC family oxidoreductase [Paracrocinitomix mangrovi]|uniref:GMC oxidoreductase n=1 Tax=Paracrocinitomix mangrovi TaxID=2862509 RepID=UPI001C8CF65D|nr:GMC family oxidoreductase [Paracrocinitomix mangrovi]UKN03072.1 GMC family oxidoreductase [Paracrocinitomix mangrovi]